MLSHVGPFKFPVMKSFPAFFPPVNQDWHQNTQTWVHPMLSLSMERPERRREKGTRGVWEQWDLHGKNSGPWSYLSQDVFNAPRYDFSTIFGKGSHSISVIYHFAVLCKMHVPARGTWPLPTLVVPHRYTESLGIGHERKPSTDTFYRDKP